MMHSDEARKRVLKQGWLKKQGGLVKTWHWRWFILNGDCLFYFTKEDDLKIQGSIYLPGNRIIEHGFKPEEPDKFLFEILPAKGQAKMSANHESFLLCGVSNAERQEWIAIIRKVMYSSLGGAIFGQRLEETMMYEHKHGNDIPYIVEQTVEFLLENGRDVEGIFRLAGRTALLRGLKEAFDTGEHIIFDKAIHDVHTVASLLKTYFRELPESIIPCNFYQQFMNHALSYQDNNLFGEVEKLKKSLEKLPDDNYRILAYVCQFLYKVSLRSEVNKMTQWNLATVFGPNIIKHIDDNPTLFMATADLTQVLASMMIENCAFLFPEERRHRTPLRSKNKVAVDDLLRMSIVSGADSDYEILTPIPSDLSGLVVETQGTGQQPHNLRLSKSLPRQDRGRLNDMKRHGKLNLDIMGQPFDSRSQPESPVSGSATGPVAATRISRYRRAQRGAASLDASSDQSSDASPTLDRSDVKQQFLPSDAALLRSTLHHMVSEPAQRPRSANGCDIPEVAGDVAAEIGDDDAFCFDEDNEVLKMELLNQKNEYMERIRLLTDNFSCERVALLERLQRERVSKSEAIEKIMALQAQLTRYHLKFGELDS